MSLQPIGDQAPLTASGAAAVVEQLLSQVAELHCRGQIHGRISPDYVSCDSGRVRLVAGPSVCELDGGKNANLCPPELKNRLSATLPTDIAAARECLAKLGLEIDPRRIDVYQLGALLLWLLSRADVATYLRSAQARGQTPSNLRSVIDRSIGCNASERCHTCEDLRQELEVALRNGGVATTPAPASADSLADQRLPAAEPARDVLGDLDRLGGFKLIERIGSGGMGDVYKAYDESLDRFVAIKVLPPELARHHDFVRRFRAEATAVAKLGHPNIVQIHTIGEDGGHHFFVMPFIRGESLAALIARQGRLSIDLTLAIAEQLLGGLDAAHNRGLIHRDIKPANILLDHDSRRALLADFGLVKTIADVSSRTATGVVMGTVDYISPEQARGKEIDARADLYSVGVLMYQMLAGRLPFEAETATAVIFKHAYERPPPLSEAAPDVPPRLGALVTRLLAKDPKHRHQSAREALAEIAAIQVQRTASNPREAPIAGRDEAITPKWETPPESQSWWERIIALGVSLVPGSLARLQDTQQQVDGAIAAHEQRCRQLEEFVRDAEELVHQCEAEAYQQRQAAAAAVGRAQATSDPLIAAEAQRESLEADRAASELNRQLEKHEIQFKELRLQLAHATEALAQLCTQRDLLLARLRAARGRMAMEGGSRERRRPWLLLGMIAGTVAMIVFIVMIRRDSKPHVLQPTQPTSGARPAPLKSPFSVDVAREAQDAWGKYLGLTGKGEVNSVGMSFVVVPPGEFEMGTPTSEAGRAEAEGPQHIVRLTKAMLVGTHEVTQRQFQSVMGYNPSYYPASVDGRTFENVDTGALPTENVSWYDACLFCNALSRKEGLPDYYAIEVRDRKGKNVVRANVTIRGGTGYRLPTEAEYEYFSRAGTTTPFWFGFVHDGTQGNVMGTRPYGTTLPGRFLSRTTAVGSYAPNPFGIFDTDGNVGEWCWDVFDASYYSRFRQQPAVDPTGPPSGEKRCIRSTSSQYEPVYARAGRRHGDLPDFVSGWNGIRLMRFAEASN